MSKYYVSAEVKREVLDNISLTVEAESLSDAFSKAKDMLEKFPEEVEGSDVSVCYIDNRMYLSNEVMSLEEDKYYA